MSDWAHQQLALRCRASGRSKAAELELLLEQRLRDDRPVPLAWEATYGARSAAFIWLLGQIMGEAGYDWLLDPVAVTAVAAQAQRLLALVNPATDAPVLHPGDPLYPILARYFRAHPRPADAHQAQHLIARLGPVAEQIAAALRAGERLHRL
jgi:hypothetical protein